MAKEEVIKLVEQISVTHSDPRRDIMEWHNNAKFPVCSMKVLVTKGEVPLGRHYHPDKTEIYFLPQGRIVSLTLIDIERGGKMVFEDLLPLAKITIPPKVAHLFVVSPDSILLGASTKEYKPEDDIPFNGF